MASESDTTPLLIQRESAFLHSSRESTWLYPSLFHGPYLVENSGSTARDLLALERTYLAWLRTSLSSITFGLGLAKFIGFESDDWTQYIGPSIGTAFCVGGMLMLIAATRHYFLSVNWLLHGKFRVNLKAPMYTLFVVGILTLMFMVFVWKFK